MKKQLLSFEVAFGIGVALGAAAMHQLDRRRVKRGSQAVELIEIEEALS